MRLTRVICFILLYILCTQSNLVQAQGVLSEEWVANPSDTSYASIIDRLEKDYDFSFSYSPNILEAETYFRTSQAKTIASLFDLIFTKKEINFELNGERRFLLYKIKKQKIEISGVIRDLDSKESIPAALIIIKELGEYVIANDDGYFYLLAENKDSISITFNSVGYKAKSFVKKESASKLTVELESQNSASIIVITPSDEDESLISPPIPDDYIRRFSEPDLGPFGLPDITQQIRNQHTVQNGNEGQSGFVVKGGSIDQNLILVDGMPVYDISHIGGLSSVFITSAVKEVKLFTEGIPSEYGGKLSSVMDVKINEGNTEKFQGDFALGLIGAEGHLEGPIVKNKTAISLSGRFNDLNFLSDSFFENFGGYEDSDLNFYDVYAKLHHKFSPTDRLSLTMYKGGDKLFLYSQDEQMINNSNIQNLVENKIQWGNELVSLQWNKLIKKNVFLSAKIGYSKYDLEGEGLVSKLFDDGRSTIVSVDAGSEIQNIVGSIKFDVYETDVGKINFGVNTIMHNFEPSINEKTWVNGEVVVDNPNTSSPSEALEVNGFVENSIDFSDNLSFRGGLHLSSFSDVDTSYFLIEPRAKVVFKQGKHLIDINISVNHQYVHFLPNPGTGLPSDIWVPSSKRLEPSRSQEVAMGYSYNFSDNLSFDFQGYFKLMQGIKENVATSDAYLALIGDSFSVTNVLTSEGNWLERIEEGRGYSTGLGGAVKYKEDRLQALFTYSYSFTRHLFPTIQEFLNVDPDALYFAPHHRPIDLFTQVSYELTDAITLSGKFVYGSGKRYTFLDTYLKGPPVQLWATERNNKSLPDFHHLDLSIDYSKELENCKLNFNLGLYNAYNRKNIFYTYLDLDENNEPRENQFGLLPRLPTFTAKVSF